eukprot:COSAG03_NODE_2167_length_3057_cov_9.477011_3_plen_47_part_00
MMGKERCSNFVARPMGRYTWFERFATQKWIQRFVANQVITLPLPRV